MRKRVRSRQAAAIAGAAAAFLAAIAASAGAQSFEQPDRVLVGTTGSSSERVSTIDIGTAPGQGATVVMSLPLDPYGLTAGDRLQASSEAEVTTDCQVEAPRCVGPAYTYDPAVDSQLILAPDPSLAGGPGTTPVSKLATRRCSHVQHHCVLVFSRPFVDISADAPPACTLAGSCFLNLVLSAYDSTAKPGDKLIIGEDEPDGTTVQDKGRVNGIRLRPVAPGPKPGDPVTTSSTKTPAVTNVPIRNKLAEGKVVVFSQALENLKRNDQLAVGARMGAAISHLRNDRILVNSQLILARRPDATRQGGLVERVAEEKGQITEANGFNCTQTATRCLTRKAGVMHLLKSAKTRSGEKVPLYVNLVVGSTAAGGQVQPGSQLRITGGALRVVRYPADRYG